MRGLGKGKVVDGKEVMLACDSVRDKVLPELGVRLEDRSDGEHKAGGWGSGLAERWEW